MSSPPRRPSRAGGPRRPLQPRDRRPPFISGRAVEYHLNKVFAKLGISSRNQLHLALGSDPSLAPPIDGEPAS